MKYVSGYRHGSIYTDRCPDCKGDGYIITFSGGYNYGGDPNEDQYCCETCNGTGEMMHSRPYILIDEHGYEHIVTKEEYTETMYLIREAEEYEEVKHVDYDEVLLQIAELKAMLQKLIDERQERKSTHSVDHWGEAMEILRRDSGFSSEEWL